MQGEFGVQLTCSERYVGSNVLAPSLDVHCKLGIFWQIGVGRWRYLDGAR